MFGVHPLKKKVSYDDPGSVWINLFKFALVVRYEKLSYF